MHVRTVKAQIQPGQVDELARRWKEYFGARRQQGGLQPRSAYLAGDRAANTTLSVTVWDAPPDEAVVGPIMREFGERVRDIVAGPPVVEQYEILAEV